LWSRWRIGIKNMNKTVSGAQSGFPVGPNIKLLSWICWRETALAM